MAIVSQGHPEESVLWAFLCGETMSLDACHTDLGSNMEGDPAQSLLCNRQGHGIFLLTDELGTGVLAIDLFFQLGLSDKWQSREVREGLLCRRPLCTQLYKGIRSAPGAACYHQCLKAIKSPSQREKPDIVS